MRSIQFFMCFPPDAADPSNQLARREPAQRYTDVASGFARGMAELQIVSRYGVARVFPVTAVMPVREISSDLPVVQANLISMDQAEQLTLITGNQFARASTVFPITGDCFVILHDSPSTAAICSMEIEQFACGTSAQQMLEYLSMRDRSFAPQTL